MQFMVGIVSRDIRSTTARNLRYIREESGLDPRIESPENLRKKLLERKMAVPDEDKWRIPYLCRLLEERQQSHYLGEDISRVTELIDALCIN